MLSAFLNESFPTELHLSLRSDGIKGNGSVIDPCFGGTSLGREYRVQFELNINEALGDTGVAHGFVEGDVVSNSWRDWSGCQPIQPNICDLPGHTE
jgi:hypothetical protein